MKTAQDFEWTPSQLRQLEAQDFEQRAPGTILQDFEALLNLIGEQGLPVTPGHLLTMKSLETINRSLTHPLELRLKRAMQKSYPHINGLYLLLRATGLALIDTQFKKPQLKLDPPILASWHSLNAAERYFALLKAWWGRASEEIIGERGPPGGGEILMKILPFLKDFLKSGTLTVKTPQEAERFRYFPGFYNLALLELFGMLEIRTKAPAAGQGWQPKRMQITDWGKTLLDSYANFIQQSLAPEAELALPLLGFTERFELLEYFESWSQLLRPHIKEWHKDLEIPELSFQPGPHRFKVSLGTACWRRLAIPGNAHLTELASTILDAFDFDSDHLYRFSYKDRFGRTVEIDHPYLADHSDHALADEVKVGDLPLFQGMHIGFLFDFGDQWDFDIQTEEVNSSSAINKPRILEKHGKAPEQYGDW